MFNGLLLRMKILELMLLQLIIFRAVYFGRVTLVNTIRSHRATSDVRLSDIHKECERLQRVLPAVKPAYMNEYFVELQGCSTRLHNLETALQMMSPSTLLQVFSSNQSEVHLLASQILKSASTPTDSHQCSTWLICTDWKGMFDLAPVLDIVSIFLPFSTSRETIPVLLYSLSSFGSIYLSAIIIRSLIDTILRRIWQSRVSAPLILIRALLSHQYRMHRIIAIIAIYTSCFTVSSDCLDWTIFMRIFQRLSMLQVSYMSASLLIFFLLLHIFISTESIHSRLVSRMKQSVLSRVDSDIAHQWMELPTHHLARLNPYTLIKVLKHVDISNMSERRKHELLCMVSSSSTLMGLYHLADSHSYPEGSDVHNLCGDVALIFRILGYRDPPLPQSSLLVFVITYCVFMLYFILRGSDTV